jgi:hypothetical protein
VNNALSQLNLTVQERRVVFAIFAVVFLVLNWWWVWPHFGDWRRLNIELDDMRRKEEIYNRAIHDDLNPANGWQKQVAKLASQQGGTVMDNPVDPQNQLNRTIQAQERKTGVTVGSYSPGSVKTNEFFEEHSTVITVESLETQLVSFLYNMGNDPAMIRVAKLDLRPVDANRYRLKGGITLTANYAKKQTAASSSIAVKPAPGSKSAGAPAQPGQHPPGGPPAPEANKKPAIGSKPLPLPKFVPSQKAAGKNL